MDLLRLIDELTDPSAYPFEIENVVVHQTHISAVFLAGAFAYKIKKPVDFGFLDFRALDQRRHFCDEEVRLNRRLAPGVYLGVVPITWEGGQLRVEGQGEVVEWAVKMTRLPDEARFDERLQRGELDATTLRQLAERVAAFHQAAEAGPHIAESARFDVVARNALENCEEAEPLVDHVVSRRVLERLHARTSETLEQLRNRIEARAARGVPRDTHGDLRLEHVYLLPDRTPPANLIIVDCIEFNERFRHADPINDMAFLVMDLFASNRRDLAQNFVDSYFHASGDVEGPELLPFFVSYRAAVRGKVEGLAALERELSEAERAEALRKARGHWLLALSELEPPGRKPCLVLVGGLPGTGKSTLAADLATASGFEIIRSDVVRKELAGLRSDTPATAAYGKGIYTSEWSERTYAECLRRAEALLFEGKRVLVDATFAKEPRRQSFLQAAQRWCVPGMLLICQADPHLVRARIVERHGDASDAEWAIYQAVADRWDELKDSTLSNICVINTGYVRSDIRRNALDALRHAGISDGLS